MRGREKNAQILEMEVGTSPHPPKLSEHQLGSGKQGGGPNPSTAKDTRSARHCPQSARPCHYALSLECLALSLDRLA